MNAGPDERRFEELYRESYRPLVRLCRRYVGSHGDAEAIAQEAFSRAWESWESFSDDRPFWPWVATIARRLCINDSLRRGRYDRLVPKALPRCTSSTPEDPVADAPFALSGAGRALRDLSPRYRRLLFLRHVEGWSYEEIARFDGATTESIRSSLKRARQTFRRIYRDVSGSVLGGLAGVLRWAWPGVLPVRVAGAEVALVALLALLAGAPTSPGAAGGGADGLALPADRSLAGVSMPAPPAEARPSSPVPVVRGVRRAYASTGAHVEASSADALDGWGYAIVASPSYEEDHTVYAAGRPEECEAYEATGCSALVRSTDGGITWRQLPARGWDGGKIMLPPAYPRDQRLFSASHRMLQVSNDGGQSFELLAPVHGLARMSPLFSAGDPRIVIGTGESATALPTAMEYRVDEGTLAPLSLPLPDDVRPMDFVFSPDYATDRAMLVTVVEMSAALFRVREEEPPRLFRCDAQGCAEVLRVGWATLLPKIRWSRGPSRAAFVKDTFQRLYRSTDGGRSFEEIEGPGTEEAVVDSVAVGPDGRLFLTLFQGHSFGNTRFYVSDDDGDTWHVLQDGGPLLFGDALTVLPDGVVLAGRSRDAGGGIARSVDGGRTWSR